VRLLPLVALLSTSSSSCFMLLSPLGERLGEGVMQEAIFVLLPLT
jgi:hypothetical protein